MEKKYILDMSNLRNMVYIIPMMIRSKISQAKVNYKNTENRHKNWGWIH